jgi:hypothetical protein
MITYDNDILNKLIVDLKDEKIDQESENYLNIILKTITDYYTKNSAAYYVQNNDKKRMYKNYKNKPKQNKNNQEYDNTNTKQVFNDNMRKPIHMTASIVSPNTITSPTVITSVNDTIPVPLLLPIESVTNNFRLNRLKEINNKSDHEVNIINCRKILNKITNDNYFKLKTEFLSNYKLIYKLCVSDNAAEFEELTKINTFIFEYITFNNTIFSEIYCNLLANLIDINSDFKTLLDDNLDKFINIFSCVIVHDKNSPIHNHSNIEVVNKNNDKYKCLCVFYINCVKTDLIPSELMYSALINLFEELNACIFNDSNDKKDYCELLTEYLILIVKNSTSIINSEESNSKESNPKNKIISYIENIKNLKTQISSYTNLSMKIIFKMMNLYDLINKK